MVPEARLARTKNGLSPASDGWFVLNVRDARWFGSEGLGRYGVFESEKARFSELGIAIGMLRPGEPNAMYHAEEAQEDFLVLAGECILIVEGQERRLRAWDFVHCPPWTEHVFVGAGTGPCLVVALGARHPGRGLRFPVDEKALEHGAGVPVETSDAREAYARFPADEPIPCPRELFG